MEATKKFKTMNTFLEVSMLQVLRTSPDTISSKTFTDWMLLPEEGSISRFITSTTFQSRKIKIYNILKYESATNCERLLNILHRLHIASPF